MIIVENSRFQCDSCDEVDTGKIIIVTGEKIISEETLQLCNDCLNRLKYMLEVENG